MNRHLGRIAAVTTLLVLCMVYPFVPGKYDPLAVALSTMAQLFGTAGLLVVPIALPWLAYELRKQARRKRNLPYTSRGFLFAIASLIAASIVIIAVSLVIFLGLGFSFGVLSVALWLYSVSRLIPGLKLLKKAEPDKINPTPLYLLFIPVAALVFQLALAAPATNFSRTHAIRQSAILIDEIEKHRATHGRYPGSLLAVWKDYYPSVISIDQFHYAPNGEAYNLFFEQPRFLLDNIGTREFVMYNKLDEHLMLSHAGWILELSPPQLAANQGWYAVHDGPSPHWKCFWFD